MRWDCDRECGLEGEKRYPTAADAQRYARSFDCRDSDDLGKRPTLSLLPLWLGRKAGRALAEGVTVAVAEAVARGARRGSSPWRPVL